MTMDNITEVAMNNKCLIVILDSLNSEFSVTLPSIGHQVQISIYFLIFQLKKVLLLIKIANF